MVEGPMERFRQYVSVKSVADKKLYIYDAANQLQDVLESPNASLKVWTIKHLTNVDIATLDHPGVKVYTYEHRDKIYMLSVKNEVENKYPGFSKLVYADIVWMKGVSDYFHNEHGPANLCVDTKEGIYFWHGEKLSKDKWEIMVKGKNFNKKFDDWLNT